ncbi:MAG TPA: hypothetical protein DIW17_16775 [Clostridiales bacterium]|nr:hypothetical protein [Clostridiales bacterium]
MKQMKKQELYRWVGHSSQLYSLRHVILQDGSGKGTDIFEVSTAVGLELDVLPAQGIDIGRLRYKGVNISFISKNGYDSPERILPYEKEFLHTFPAGMLYTCGLRNVGPPCRDKDEWFPQHGRYHGLVAANPSAYVEKDFIVIRGIMRESALFGHCLQLGRIIRIPIWGSEIIIEDILENLTLQSEEFMFLYHVNFGYPMLSDEARLILPEGRETMPRTAFAKAGLGKECTFEPPIDSEEERVYFHKLPKPVIRLENPDLNITAEITWSNDTLPVLAQWRSMASGDYVLGLEPSNCFIMGRNNERDNGTLRIIKPFEQIKFSMMLRLEEMQ